MPQSIEDLYKQVVQAGRAQGYTPPSFEEFRTFYINQQQNKVDPANRAAPREPVALSEPVQGIARYPQNVPEYRPMQTLGNFGLGGRDQEFRVPIPPSDEVRPGALPPVPGVKPQAGAQPPIPAQRPPVPTDPNAGAFFSKQAGTSLADFGLRLAASRRQNSLGAIGEAGLGALQGHGARAAAASAGALEERKVAAREAKVPSEIALNEANTRLANMSVATKGGSKVKFQVASEDGYIHTIKEDGTTKKTDIKVQTGREKEAADLVEKAIEASIILGEPITEEQLTNAMKKVLKRAGLLEE